MTMKVVLASGVACAFGKLNVHLGESPRSFIQGNALASGIDMGSLAENLGYGGLRADQAARGLLAKIDDQDSSKAAIGKNVMGSAHDLQRRESTPTSLKYLAGSIVSKLSRHPAIAESADDEGSSGVVSIVMPSPSQTYSSFLNAVVDIPAELLSEGNKNDADVNVIVESFIKTNEGSDFNGCPAFWGEYRGTCAAPPGGSYCGATADFLGLNVAGKIALALQCGATYDKNPMTNPCPKGWGPAGSSCVAPVDYNGRCTRSIPVGLNYQAKVMYSNMCGLQY